MHKKVVPSILLLAFIAGLPKFAETAYMPALPNIANDLCTTGNLVEFTITAYLFSFACGGLFWGNFSEFFGRRPALLSSLIVFSIGSLSCALSEDITLLTLSRLVQGFGAGAGSTLSQAIGRDIFQDATTRARAYSTIAIGISIAPALGPIFGGFISSHFRWQIIFYILALLVGTLLSKCALSMKETRPYKKNKFKLNNLLSNIKEVMLDDKIVLLGLVMAIAVGSAFSCQSELSFIFIDILDVSPQNLGFLWIFVAISFGSGGFISRHLNSKGIEALNIAFIGCLLQAIATILFLTITTLGFVDETYGLLPIVTLMATMVFIGVSQGLIFPNVISTAANSYGHAAGTLTSIFGFIYWGGASIIAAITSYIHNGTPYPLPFFLVFLTTFMFYSLHKARTKFKRA